MTQKLKMKQIPKQDRPRERLVELGASNLSSQELLAIIIGSGTKTESVQDLAKRLYAFFQGDESLREASIEELTSIKGIGLAKAVNILASLELGKRAFKKVMPERLVIRSPQDGAEFVMEEMRLLKQEHFVCLFLNTKNQIIHRQTIFIGSLSASIVHPREVFREAVKRSAASLICIHNHPSGVRL
ncbi:DNA replication and repair protein RadC [Pelagirhabdus alkalitolerans]|uniref:DNA replication and repair protein RadC n=1 Tax=Pelagirhabdus alkalitolerans TaxID=1612202 RepID=A0A1G6HQY3_9BACI|nr:DNA repair protein RadC [Pelagirhabdus alkalitolerans]SDB95896.1 DNA replication and repair protein RadC [Pelagirhabdus alkalitolerans]